MAIDTIGVGEATGGVRVAWRDVQPDFGDTFYHDLGPGYNMTAQVYLGHTDTFWFQIIQYEKGYEPYHIFRAIDLETRSKRDALDEATRIMVAFALGGYE